MTEVKSGRTVESNLNNFFPHQNIVNGNHLSVTLFILATEIRAVLVKCNCDLSITEMSNLIRKLGSISNNKILSSE